MKPAKLLKLLYVQVLIALALGIAVGHYWPEFGAALKPLGDGFVKLVKMMIAPIVFCTIVSGITSLNDSREIGKTLLKSMGLFYALTILALLTGLAAVLLLQPGAGMHIDPKSLDAAVAAKFASQVPPRGFTEFVLHIVPSSFFGAFAEGEVLPVLLLSVLCGFGLTRIGASGRMVLVKARASDMKRSIPTMSATPATGRSGITVSVATSATKPLPVTPAAPLEVSSMSPSIAPICVHERWMSHAWAMNIDASVR